MKPLFDRKMTFEERLNKLETIVSRLARKSKKTASAMITPYPISFCVSGDDVKGRLMKYLFPAKGIIKRGLVTLDRAPSSNAEVTIEVSGKKGGSAKSYMIERGSFSFEPNMEITTGDLLTVSIYPDKDDKFTEVCVALYWVPHVKETEVKQHLIDDIDKEAASILNDE